MSIDFKNNIKNIRKTSPGNSKWLCWKAQEKIQVESSFCKTIACSYVTLLSAYLAMSKVSNRNTRKRCLLISKMILKTSEKRHLVTSYLNSKWLCWKAQQKIQVESSFCNTIACSYLTLLSAYLAMSKVSNRNTRKRCLLISKIILKTSEKRHLGILNGSAEKLKRRFRWSLVSVRQ